MNCEYCGRFLNSEACTGCGSPNPYLHRGDPIRLREYIEPHYGIARTAGYTTSCSIYSTSFIETGYRSLFSGDFISPSNVLRNQGDE